MRLLSASSKALPNSIASATAASFPEGNNKPYNNSSTVYTCLYFKFADELLTFETYLDIIIL